MAISNPIYEGVKVKNGVVPLVKEMVKQGYYRKSEEEQMQELKKVADKICAIYGADNVKVTRGVTMNGYACYSPMHKEIRLQASESGEHISIVSFLHELRHHLQYTVRAQAEGHNMEQDAHAWSIRVFAKACPKSFERAVERGGIAVLVKRDDGKIVNKDAFTQIWG